MGAVVARVARSLAMAFGVGRQTAATDMSASTQTVQFVLPGGELRSDVPLLQQYGFFSRPVPGADILAAFLAGDRSRGVAFASGYQDNRPSIASGDVCVHHPVSGTLIWLKSDGSIAIVPSSGQVTLEGTLTVTEDIVAKGVSLAGHVHSGVEQGGADTGVPVPSG